MPDPGQAERERCPTCGTDDRGDRFAMLERHLAYDAGISGCPDDFHDTESPAQPTEPESTKEYIEKMHELTERGMSEERSTSFHGDLDDDEAVNGRRWRCRECGMKILPAGLPCHDVADLQSDLATAKAERDEARSWAIRLHDSLVAMTNRAESAEASLQTARERIEELEDAIKEHCRTSLSGSPASGSRLARALAPPAPKEEGT